MFWEQHHVFYMYSSVDCVLGLKIVQHSFLLAAAAVVVAEAVVNEYNGV